jgi:hypothetical protein
VVARLSGQNVAAVVAVWAMLLERASDGVTQCDATKRGFVTGFDCESADVLLGLESGASGAILTALRKKGLLSDDEVTNWKKRQPKREDSSAERTRAYRERLKEKEAVTQCDAGVTQCDARREEKREDNINTPTLSSLRSERASPTAKTFPQEFLDFWAAYPKKTGKDAAYRAWQTKKRERRLPAIDDLLEAVRKAKASSQWQEDGGKYIPNPSTWLNQGRWEDEAVEDSTPRGKPLYLRDPDFWRKTQ